MQKEIILYNKTNVTFRESKYIKRAGKYIRTDICPMCNTEIQVDAEVYLVINNYILFPNIYVHTACVKSKRVCISKLIMKYKKVQRLVKKYNEASKVWHLPLRELNSC